jgi:hypothetical protein
MDAFAPVSSERQPLVGHVRSQPTSSARRESWGVDGCQLPEDSSNYQGVQYRANLLRVNESIQEESFELTPRATFHTSDSNEQDDPQKR